MSSHVNKVSFGDLPPEVLNRISRNCYEQEGLSSGLRGVNVDTRHSLLDVHARNDSIIERNPAKIMEKTVRRRKKHLEAIKKYLKMGRIDLEQNIPLAGSYLCAVLISGGALLYGVLMSKVAMDILAKQAQEQGLLIAGIFSLLPCVCMMLVGLILPSLTALVCAHSLRHFHDCVGRLNRLETQVSEKIAVLERWQAPKCDFDVDEGCL